MNAVLSDEQVSQFIHSHMLLTMLLMGLAFTMICAVVQYLFRLIIISACEHDLLTGMASTVHHFIYYCGTFIIIIMVSVLVTMALPHDPRPLAFFIIGAIPGYVMMHKSKETLKELGY